MKPLYLLLLVMFVGLEIGFAQQETTEKNYVPTHYTKKTFKIPMRDGVHLHTEVYLPKDKSRAYPVVMQRTPYSAGPYGEAMKTSLGPSETMMKECYIFAYQDVRGRWMSEGTYDNMRPTQADRSSNTVIDESTDTYDTIEFLLDALGEESNGRFGQWGISYPGFYSAASLPYAHPALKAVSPQAPIGDFYFDDFHHNGAYFLSYWVATAVFGYQHDGPTDKPWYQMVNTGTKDAYQFFMDMGSLKNADQYYGPDNFFWTQLKENPDYNSFWQERSIIPHLKENIRPAVMTVGGWFDAEDLYGPLTIYKTIEEHNPGTYNTLVMGPWSHGDWARERGRQQVSNIYFGDSLSTHYQREIEANFFRHFLKEEGDGKTGLPEAYVFDTGKHGWSSFEEWPPKNSAEISFYTHANGRLSTSPAAKDTKSSFLSDPAKPVPYSQDIKFNFTPRKYMADDQRFAARRPDVLVFETEVLEEDITLVGEILAELLVSTDAGDADWIVKLVDVFPADTPDHPHVQAGVHLSNYHMMVRSEVIRGRYREDFSKPKPFQANIPTEVPLLLQDVFHTFKKGHKIQIQIQSTWFPLIDRNPQRYVENIFQAEDTDFIPALHSVYHDGTRIKTRRLQP